MLVYVLFYLGRLSHFPSGFGDAVTSLSEPPSSLLLPPRCCELGAGSIPFGGHCEQKAVRDEGVVCVAGRPLLSGRCAGLSGCFCFPKRKL